MREIGLFGGTFDPPHVGHLVVADEVRVALGLDEVRLVVAGNPWMKGDESDPAARLAMVELAVAGDPHLVADDLEIRRGGRTYTVDTLETLHAAHPDVRWTFILGADAAHHLSRWHRAAEALALARFVVVERPGSPPAPRSVLGVDLVHVTVPPMGVSSSEIRRRRAAGGAWRHLVPPRVAAAVVDDGRYEDSHPPR